MMQAAVLVLWLVAGAIPPASALAALSGSDRLPIMATGGRLHPGKGSGPLFSRTVTLPTPGVWYLWVRVTSNEGEPRAIAYDLDGVRPRHPSRGLINVEPYLKSAWIANTFVPGFRAEVRVEKPGDHVLRLKVEGEDADLTVERIALTLAWSARPAGDTLDHRDDPGGGRAFLPADADDPGGFHDAPSGPVTATRRFHLDAEGGDDARSGLEPASAWRTLDRVNGRVFSPDDAILLKRGGHWHGTLRPAGSGTASAWITLGAYGEGPRPVVDGGGADAVAIRDESFWTIRDLEVTTDPGGEGNGLSVRATRSGTGSRPQGLRITGVVASDCGGIGIHAGGTWEASDGIDGMVIENCLAYQNRGGGIIVEGWHQGGWRDGIIRNCSAWSNAGWGGIYLNGGRHVLMDRCRTDANYFLNQWFWNALNVTMRRCEAWRCHTSGERGGFDLDYSVNASVIEDCYSHHNEHYGFMLMGNGNTTEVAPKTSRHNLVRRCVAEDDRPPFWVIETFEDSIVADNTVLATGNNAAAMEVSGWPDGIGDGGWPARCVFANNVCCGRRGAVPVSVDAEPTRQENLFNGTWFWQAESGGPLLRWGGTNWDPAAWGIKAPKLPWKKFSSLADYRRATGQDALAGVGDPGFVGPAWRGAIGLSAMAAYRPRPDGPLARAPRAPSPVTPAWLAARAKYLSDTPGLAEIPAAPAP